MNREAVEAMIRQHAGYVRRLAVRLAPDPAEADDLAQEAFLIAFRKYPALHMPEDIRPWLSGVVRNLSRQAWARAIRNNKLKRDALAEHLEALAEESSELFNEPARHALRKCLEKLPERSRTLLNLRYNLGLKSEDMAAQVSATAEAARMALVRIRQQLKGCIDKTLGEAGA